ncbi:hypothetical protein FA10DRAFT_56638 [Acaromyces ingoldii]|uniref:Uncharacterized protein n=1 Tax=Acaromyces ingoldii TaxID=215250 RepID=A0A316YC57_9BASI|nr:hypothetical protein FA10DRAFT_56638 [Acaromyces ingoldii]PWN86484.1 hypothetical protein FA10DRAFT_56638 [Acaromyces ingoldii]
MSERLPAQLVFDSASVPRQRPRARAVSAKCCCYSFALIIAAFVLCAFALLAQTTYKIARNIASPHEDLTAKSTSIDVIKPLINSTSRFDILATVWLDVTQHVAAGKQLPSETRVVTYTSPAGPERSEAILFSGNIVANTTMLSRVHGKARIKVPIEPLYSQSLGPSTLRATFQLKPHDQSALGTFESNRAIYPAGLPVGPRSPSSPLLFKEKSINETSRPGTFTEALEHSSVNANLLTLLPSKWRLEDAMDNLRERKMDDLVDPYFDRSAANCAFANRDDVNSHGRHLYVGKEQQLMIPHIITRTRLVLVKEEREFDAVHYMKRWKEAISQFSAACKDIAERAATCSRPYQFSLFENLISTRIVEGEPSRHFYAPFLVQPWRTIAPRHHRTLPLSKSWEAGALPVEADEGKCLIPMLDVDASGEHFVLDWDVPFSSHSHMRASMAETVHSQQSLATSASVTILELPAAPRVNISESSDIEWQVQAYGFGDREHQKSRPTLSLLSHAVETIFWLICLLLLEPLYWYSRETSAGLSGRGQWMLIAAACLDVWPQVNVPRSFDFLSITALLYLLFSIAPLLFMLSVLLRLEYVSSRKPLKRRLRRRPAESRERLTARLDGRFGWVVPIALLAFFLATIRFVEPHKVAVKASVGCHHTDEQALSIHLLQLSYALSRSGQILQMWHNVQSRSFAGSFKLSVLLTFFAMVIGTSIDHVEIIGGWKPSRDDITLSDVEDWLLAVVLLYQALSFPGVRQDADDYNKL